MKKIFLKFWQWIVKYRKNFVYGVLALGVLGFCFFGVSGTGMGNEVFAEEGTQVQNQKVDEKFTERKSTMSFFNKVCNVFIYPMLIVAGKLVDNSFVYGEIFKFDAVLWKLWNIVKNLANFTLGFFFLYKILKYLVSGKGEVKKTLLSALAAGVGIQASWFIMAALVDISTILAYGVGGLPISVLKESGGNASSSTENQEYYNPYIMKTVISVDVKDVDTMYTYLTNTSVGDKESGQFYISECQTFSYGASGSGGRELILAPKMVYYEASRGNYVPTDSKRCHYYGNIYYFKELYSDSADNLQELAGGDGKFLLQGSGTGTQRTYEEKMTNIRSKITGNSGENIVNLISNGVVLEIGDAHKTGGVWGGLWNGVYGADDHVGLDKYNKWTGTEGGEQNTSRLEDILDGDSYVGVFTTLYSSLVNSRERRVTKDDGLFAGLLNVALELGYTLAISIPLVVVAVIFMMRVGVLWLAIVLSPFIVLATAFKEIGDKIFKSSKILENLKLENLVPIIFSPAIICFAVSMSTVMITILSGFNGDLKEGMNPKEILGGLVVLEIGEFSVPLAKIIISILGVAITWFLVRAAIGTSKLGESSIVKSLKSLAKSSLGSIPIIPVPTKDGGVDFVGTTAVFGDDMNDGVISRMAKNIKTTYDNKSSTAMEQLWKGGDMDAESKKKQLEAYKKGLGSIAGADWVTSEIKIGENKDYPLTFDSFKDDLAAQDDIIKAINAMGIEERKKIPEGHQVQVGDKTYKFVYEREKKNENGEVIKDAKGKPEIEQVYQYE